ncbi:hypothetical protein MMC18_003973 [Xylographa bjoerkii]|nr:hypothetical protein [Xylographa bjoerkii]
MHACNLLPGQSLHTSALPSTLTLCANPDTDIWSVPPSTQRFSAPFTCVSIPTPSFRSITATISASFTTNTQQGGLLLVLPPRAGTNPSEEGRRWITATLEYEHGRMNLSVVSCRQWADWSLQACDRNRVVLKMERRANADGTMGPRLIVSVKGADEGWTIIREVTWVFTEEEGELWVGVLANQASGPDATGNNPARKVYFEDIKVETI